MRPIHFSILLVLLFSAVLLNGCASQNKTTNVQPEITPQSASAETVDSEIENSEEEAFLEEDFEDWGEDEEIYTIADPIEPFNRAMFAFNDTLYEWLLKPISLGYRKITPQPVRTGVGNFFYNLGGPIRFVSCILQGKGQAAAAEFARFTLNTVYGVLGFVDITKGHPELNPDPEDLGQTLGSYNIGDGFYIVLPFFGPSTLRDSVGRIGDAFLDPVNYVEPVEASIAARGFNTVNTISFRAEDIDAAKKAAFDPYQAARDFYIQSRQTKLKR